MLKNVVPHEVIDQLNRDIEVAWEGHNPEIHVEHWVDHVLHVSPVSPDLKHQTTKLLDFYVFSEAARQSIFADPIRNFLKLIFERPAMAFQSLYFITGSHQPMHQDTAYVVVSSAIEFAASWIALEDIQPNTGELEYYEGSHKLREYLFQGQYKNMPLGDPEHQKYLDSLHTESARMGLKRKKFRPKKGDVLIWHADLVHGGSRDDDPQLSRKSIVTHYCPVDLDPGYFKNPAHGQKLRYAPGCYYCYPIRLPRTAS